VKRAEIYVVTLGIDYDDGESVIHELCRGDPHDCVAVMHRVSTPSHDTRTISHWWLQFGTARDWEAYIHSA
jgi:hypothetical protein